MTWLPPTFVHPTRLDLFTGHHLRAIRADDVGIDYPAVMGSRERLWSIYGEAWGWPLASMTVEQDRADLARHEREIAAHESFNYAVLAPDEQELFGCVYIDPPEHAAPGVGAVVSWWVVDRAVGSDLERALDAAVPAWMAAEWPLENIRFGV